MDTKTLEALKGSIEKWRLIVEENGHDEGPRNCPLCELFLLLVDDDGNSCNGCPVSDWAGKPYCKGTPYRSFVEESDDDGRATTDLAMARALAELHFLRSLLPREEAP